MSQTIQEKNKALVLITDGEETSSSHYTLPHVREMITRRQKACGSSFIVIAPNAASLAFKLGIPVTHARNWKSDPAAINGLLERVSKTISAYQLGDKKAMLRLSEYPSIRVSEYPSIRVSE
jgi:hypothetical protein